MKFELLYTTIIISVLTTCSQLKQPEETAEDILLIQHSHQNCGISTTRITKKGKSASIESEIEKVYFFPEGTEYKEQQIDIKLSDNKISKYKFRDYYDNFEVEVISKGNVFLLTETVLSEKVNWVRIEKPALILDDAYTFLHHLDGLPENEWCEMEVINPEKRTVNSGRILIADKENGQRIYLWDGTLSHRIYLNDHKEIKFIERSDGFTIKPSTERTTELTPAPYPSVWIPADSLENLSLYAELKKGLPIKAITIELEDGDISFRDYLSGVEIELDQQSLTGFNSDTSVYENICEILTTKHLTEKDTIRRVEEWVRDNITRTTESLEPEEAFAQRKGDELTITLIARGMLEYLSINTELVKGLIYDHSNSQLRSSYWLILNSEEGEEMVINPLAETAQSQIRIPLFYGGDAFRGDIIKLNLIDYEIKRNPRFNLPIEEIEYEVTYEGQKMGVEVIDIVKSGSDELIIDFFTDTVWNESGGTVKHDLRNSENIYTVKSEKKTDDKTITSDRFIFNPAIISTVYPVISGFPENNKWFSAEIINPDNNETATITIEKIGEERLWIDDEDFDTSVFKIKQLDIKFWIDESGVIIKYRSPHFLFSFSP